MTYLQAIDLYNVYTDKIKSFLSTIQNNRLQKGITSNATNNTIDSLTKYHTIDPIQHFLIHYLYGMSIYKTLMCFNKNVKNVLNTPYYDNTSNDRIDLNKETINHFTKDHSRLGDIFLSIDPFELNGPNQCGDLRLNCSNGILSENQYNKLVRLEEPSDKRHNSIQHFNDCFAFGFSFGVSLNSGVSTTGTARRYGDQHFITEFDICHESEFYKTVHVYIENVDVSNLNDTNNRIRYQSVRIIISRYGDNEDTTSIPHILIQWDPDHLIENHNIYNTYGAISDNWKYNHEDDSLNSKHSKVVYIEHDVNNPILSKELIEYLNSIKLTTFLETSEEPDERRKGMKCIFIGRPDKYGSDKKYFEFRDGFDHSDITTQYIYQYIIYELIVNTLHKFNIFNTIMHNKSIIELHREKINELYLTVIRNSNNNNTSGRIMEQYENILTNSDFHLLPLSVDYYVSKIREKYLYEMKKKHRYDD